MYINFFSCNYFFRFQWDKTWKVRFAILDYISRPVLVLILLPFPFFVFGSQGEKSDAFEMFFVEIFDGDPTRIDCLLHFADKFLFNILILVLLGQIAIFKYIFWSYCIQVIEVNGVVDWFRRWLFWSQSSQVLPVFLSDLFLPSIQFLVLKIGVLENCLAFHFFLSEAFDFAAFISSYSSYSERGCAADPLFE